MSKSKPFKPADKLAVYVFPNDTVIEVPKGIDNYMFPMRVELTQNIEKHDGKECVTERGAIVFDRHKSEIFTCYDIYPNRNFLTEDNDLNDYSINHFFKTLPSELIKVNALIQDKRKRIDLDKKTLDERLTYGLNPDIVKLKDEALKKQDTDSAEYIQLTTQIEEADHVKGLLEKELAEAEALEQVLNKLNDDLVYALSVRHKKDIEDNKIRRRTEDEMAKALIHMGLDKEELLHSLEIQLTDQNKYDHLKKVIEEESEIKKEMDKVEKKKEKKLKQLEKQKEQLKDK